MLVRLTLTIIMVVASLSLTDAACSTQSDCQTEKQYCMAGSLSSYCEPCDDCLINLGRKYDDGRDRVVGGTCPSWCMCQASTDCGDRMYCMKNKDNKNTCSACSTCMDGASVEGNCNKCTQQLRCTSHDDCPYSTGTFSYCTLSHQCKKCDMNCVVPPYTSTSAFPWSWEQVGPIDGKCPATCTAFDLPQLPKFAGSNIGADNYDALYHLPWMGSEDSLPTSDYTYKSGLGSSSSSVVPTTACSATSMSLMGRDVNKVVCADLATAQSTCDSNKMSITVEAERGRMAGGIPKVTKFSKTFYNDFKCAVADVVKGALGLLAIIFIVLGSIVGLCLCVCLVCCYLGVRRRRQEVIVVQQAPVENYAVMMTPSNCSAPQQ